ncbi:Flap-structured DNA-binding and RNA-binding protein [Coemansia sp. RSA 2336]|nr:Flap-structured DNA-binding and RNA-binding protein [Coemansia sp. RSA 2336]
MSGSTTSTTSAAAKAEPQQTFNPPQPALAANKTERPASELFFANAQHPLPEAKHADRWFESLSQFEDMLEDMAKVSLDSEFKNELDTIDDWFSVLAEPERTAALYSLMQHCSDLQVRFFITILQQMLVMDQASEANGAPAGAAGDGNVHGPERHSIAVQGAYAKNQAPQVRQPGAGRMSYDSGPAGANPAFGGIRGAPGLPMISGSPSVQRAGGWNANDLSPDNLLLMGSGNGAKPSSSHGGGPADVLEARRVSGFGDPMQQRPKSSSHEADASSDWRMSRTGAAASPSTEHFAHQQLGIGAVGASRRQSNNLLTQQSTPRVSVDMEPKDFRWSSLTESLEPFGNIGTDPNASALTHMIDANMNRTSGIAARRSVSNRLSIAVKSPRDTMQAQQQQHLAANLAQMSISGANGGGAGQQHLSSPLAATFSQQQQQQQQQSRGAYGAGNQAYGYNQQYYAGYAGNTRMQGGGAAVSSVSSVSTTPVRANFPRSNAGTPIPGQNPAAAQTHSPAALKPQPDGVDLELVKDIPAWLRSLRLHKYTDCFAGMDWTSVVSLTDEQLQAKGVAALGARRKMLKVFESVRQEADKYSKL